jgi:biotin-[acetyl-CoA-carboxylase] ligase BirA-like protein
MNRAREAALTGASDGLVITAGRQSAGRGTGDKSWESPEGSLLFTLITRPRLDAADLHRQVLAAQCAAVRAIRSVTGREAIPAWPNDLLVETDQALSWGKAGGILAEALVSGNSVNFIDIGIGINTGSRPAARGSASISAGRRALLTSFLGEAAHISSESSDLVPLWNSLNPAVGRPVTFTRRGNAASESGIFRGVDRSGWAVIVPERDAPDSFDHHFPPGTISIQKKGNIA